MKLLSLFDGSGCFPLAASLCGVIPVMASEIEPYPIAVTKSRFPEMKHLGNVAEVKGDQIEPVDIITFGSPCQDMSVAGKRAGLKHTAAGDEETTRSGLFIEAIRIIKEMRLATNGKYPRYAVWENVPGAFSSNKGEDFRTVLEEFIRISETDAVMPSVPKAGWAYADCISGDGWSVAYRTFDAQYWGVPQRRRRIYLVADFRGGRAGKILFEREGLRGHTAQSGTQREDVTENVGNGIKADDRSVGVAEAVPVCYAMQAFGKYVQSDKGGALKARDYKDATDLVVEEKPIVLDRAFFNQGQNAKYDPQFYTDGICPTLVAKGPAAVQIHYIVRRLTPTECARLQGFPDKWGHPDKKEDFTEEEYKFWLEARNTYAKINGKPEKEYTKAQMLTWYSKLHTDSAEYKMWGNGMALPNALYVMQGIVAAEAAETELQEQSVPADGQKQPTIRIERRRRRISRRRQRG